MFGISEPSTVGYTPNRAKKKMGFPPLPAILVNTASQEHEAELDAEIARLDALKVVGPRESRFLLRVDIWNFM